MTTKKEAAARDAAAILRRHWAGRGFPVDPVAIARDLGLGVLVGQLGPNVSGMLIKEQDEDPVVYVDVDDAPRRQRFTVAHEIGHYVERSSAPTMSYVDRRGGPFTLREFYANEFAGHLLMPADEVLRLQSQGWTDFELSEYFGVSPDAMGTRLRRLALA